MLRDFLNIRQLDPFRKIGRYAQLFGFVMIVSPVASAAMRSIGPGPRRFSMLDGLPHYNPTVVAEQHPVWLAIISAPVGVVVALVGSCFLATLPWARLAMHRLCLMGAAALLLAVPLYLVPLFGSLAPFPRAAMVVGAVLCFLFAGTLYMTARVVESPEIRAKFQQSGESQ